MAPTPLAQRLVLLSLDPARGTLRRRNAVAFGAAGGVLADLALNGAIALDGKKVVATGSEPGELAAMEAEVMAAIADHRHRRPERWVNKFRRRALQDALAGLATNGLVEPHEMRVLGLFKTTRYRLKSPAPVEADREAVRALLNGASPRDETDVELARLLIETHLLKVVLPGSRVRDARRRLDQLGGHPWVAKGVRRAIANQQAAASAGS